ncbi:MAG: GNAT family N-acetyltransferase [Pseudomonadota bacterium]
MQDVIETNRLTLRPPVDADGEVVIGGFNDFDVVKWLANPPYPFRQSDLHLRLEDGSSRWPGLACIEHRGAMIGMVSAEPHFGYWLLKHAWGHGFATEAGRAMRDAAFHRGADYISSGYFAGNTASEAVLTKLGFQHVGESRQWCEARQQTLPHHDMWLDRSDWDAATA